MTDLSMRHSVIYEVVKQRYRDSLLNSKRIFLNRIRPENSLLDSDFF